jgi:hypothetical protein
MSSIGKVVILMVASSTVGCCSSVAAVSKPVPLNEALAALDRDLRNVAPVSLSDADDVAGRDSRIVNAIVREQCRQDNANPIVMIATGPLTLQLQGQFQVSGQVSFSISATPSVGGQTTVQQQQQQQISVPISFVSVLGLPNFYVGQAMANYANFSDSDKAKNGAEIVKTRDKLAALTVKAAKDYKDVIKPQCPKVIAGTLNATTFFTQLVQQ